MKVSTQRRGAWKAAKIDHVPLSKKNVLDYKFRNGTRFY